MFGNRWNFRSEQSRNLRLRQPHAIVLHANIQTGLTVGRLVYDNFTSIHMNKYRKIRPHLQKSSHLDFSPKITIFVLSCKEIRRRRRRNRQAGARPCKKTVGDAGIGTKKASQTADIHQAYKCAGAPLSTQSDFRGRIFESVLFFVRISRMKSAPAAYCSRSGFFFPAVGGYSTVSVIG